MKKLIWLILFIISLDLVAASYELKNHEPVTINGRTFELSGRGENQVYVKVDGKTTKVTELLEYKDGVYMQLLSYSDPYEDVPLIANVEISMAYTCGNEICETGENDYCCSDCNCTTGSTCAKNKCYLDTEFECFTDIECSDNNPCTIDTCSGSPFTCTHNFTTECVSGDNCCPQGCNSSIDYINNDNECLPEPECWTDFDCEDNDETTINLCDRKEKFCKFEILVIGGVPVKSDAININESVEGLTASINDSIANELIEQKKRNWTDYIPEILIAFVLLISYISFTIFKNSKNNNL